MQTDLPHTSDKIHMFRVSLHRHRRGCMCILVVFVLLSAGVRPFERGQFTLGKKTVGAETSNR